MFKDTMESIGQPCIPSKVVNTVEDAVDFANQEGIGYPLIVRPAFTLGGTGGGIVNDEEEPERDSGQRPLPLAYHSGAHRKVHLGLERDRV